MKRLVGGIWVRKGVEERDFVEGGGRYMGRCRGERRCIG